jgi:hypothetical protein
MTRDGLMMRRRHFGEGGQGWQHGTRQFGWPRRNLDLTVACLGGPFQHSFNGIGYIDITFLCYGALWHLLVPTAMPHLARDLGWIVDEAEAFW